MLSARAASFAVLPVFSYSKTFFAPEGKVIFGRPLASEALGLGEADFSPSVSAPATLSLFLAALFSSLPQADSVNAAAAVSANAASRVGRRFTVGSR